MRARLIHKQPYADRPEDSTNQQPRTGLRPSFHALRHAHEREDQKHNGERGEDVFCGHSRSHLSQQPSLPPRWRARVEERRARLQQAEIVCGKDSLSLIAIPEHVDTVCLRDW